MKCKNCVRHVHLNDDGERTIGTPNWCFYLSDSPDEELERDCIVFKPLTNADRIRAMTDEELAEFMGTLPCCPPGVDVIELCRLLDTCDGTDCEGTELQVKCWLEWLKKEEEHGV